MEFLGIPRMIFSAACWMLLVFCAAGLTGCGVETTGEVSVETTPSDTRANSKALEKVAMEFCNKTRPDKNKSSAAKTNEKNTPPPACPKQIFISTAPWTLLAPPRDYPGELTPKTTVAIKPAKATGRAIKKKTKIKTSTKKSPAIQERQIATPQPRKKFIATTPWTLLAPPRDYAASPQPAEKEIWLPCKSAKSTKSIAARRPVKKPAKKIVKKSVKKPAVVVKAARLDWSWPSSARRNSRSRRGQLFPATTPWAQVAPASEQTARLDMSITTAELPQLPAPQRRMVCELRIIRISDGQVLSSASAVATYRNIAQLARALVGEFGRDGRIPIGAEVVAVSLSNREGSDQGLLVAEKMTEHVVVALKRASKFRFLKRIDLREVFDEEQKLECSRCVTAPTLHKLMRSAKYIIVGGIALHDPTRYRPSEPDDAADIFAAKSACYGGG